MSELAIEINEFMKLAAKMPVIDVRTPAEYIHAHIPGAINLPIFSNEERSVIGTLYLKKGSSEAIMKGLGFIRPKLKDLAETGHTLVPGGEALMHCWRGGMRSSSMAWLMNTAGIRTYTLIGGYKNFRRYTAECFKRPLKIITLGGMTGSGKTDVLKALKLKNKQVIDLEELANHKGSVFGGIGMTEQPSTEQFENDLFCEIMKLDPEQPVFIEDESLAIGKIFIPRSIYDQVSASVLVRLNVPFENRMEKLVSEYSIGSQDELADAVKQIEKRLGLKNAALAIRMIRSGNMADAVKIILNYYDKIYARSMGIHTRKSTSDIQINRESPDEIAEIILSTVKKWN